MHFISYEYKVAPIHLLPSPRVR